MRYRVFIYCRDCSGEDYQGCFDGGSEEVFLDTDGSVTSDDIGLKIETREDAERLGDIAVRPCGQWSYEIEETNDGLR